MQPRKEGRPAYQGPLVGALSRHTYNAAHSSVGGDRGVRLGRRPTCDVDYQGRAWFATPAPQEEPFG